MTDLQLRLFKILLAAVGCAWLLWRRRQARPRMAALATLGLALAAIAAYFHGFSPPYERYYHRWEMFHYYLGAKYAPELGYERLYPCVAVADAETGIPAIVAARRARDLTTDELVLAQTWLAEPASCKRHFGDARWRDFTRDVVWFRNAANDAVWWEQMQQDHGYNASPVWTMIARPLADLAPASDGLLRALAGIDLALMVGCLGAIAWGFGWQLAALGALFWGTQAASDFFWTGGAFLRQDWLCCSVLGVALLRRQRGFAAGALLMAAGLLRVFPLLLWAGPLLVLLRSPRRQGRVARSSRRCVAGGAVCAVLLLGASGASQGPEAYAGFARRIWLHASSPISNHISLRALFAASPHNRLETAIDPRLVDPVRPWADARRQRSAQLQPLQLLTAAALVGTFAVVAWRLRRLWLAACLSVVLIPVLCDPSCYYYSVFLLAVPLCAARKDLAVMLLALAGAGQLLCLRFPWSDDRFVALSALYLACSLALLAAFARWPGVRNALAPRARPHQGELA